MDTDIKLNSQPSPAAPAETPVTDSTAPVERQTSEQASEELFKTTSDEKVGDNQPVQQPQAPVKKKKTKLVDLPMNVRVPQLTKEEINISIENEVCLSPLFCF